MNEIDNFKIQCKKEKERQEETLKRSKAFCQPDRKSSIESFIESIETISKEDRLNKLKSLNKHELKMISEKLGKGIRTDVHVISNLIGNRYIYTKIGK